MFYILFFNALLFLECFGNTKFEALIRANIEKSLFYNVGDISLDNLLNINAEELSQKPALINLIFKKDPLFPNSHIELDNEKILPLLKKCGYTELFNYEGAASLIWIPYFLGEPLSNLFGFNIPMSEVSSKIIIPNIAALNLRLRIYRDYFQKRYSISGSQNIAKIYFYSASEKISDPSLYLKQLALRRLPIASLPDGGGVFFFHDLIHLMTFILPEALIDGYVQFAKDSIIFIETEFTHPKVKNDLYSLIARSIDAEIANFIMDFSNIFIDTQYEEHYELKYGSYVRSQKSKVEKLFVGDLSLYNSSSAEEKNTFFDHMKDLFHIYGKKYDSTVFIATEILDIFQKSNDPIKAEIESHIYWPNGLDLYYKAREHLVWMKKHAKESHDIHRILSLPKE